MVEFTYFVDHLPHPQAEHLASRLRGVGGKLKKYHNLTGESAIIVVEGPEETNDLVTDYLSDHHVTVADFLRDVESDPKQPHKTPTLIRGMSGYVYTTQEGRVIIEIPMGTVANAERTKAAILTSDRWR